MEDCQFCNLSGIQDFRLVCRFAKCIKTRVWAKPRQSWSEAALRGLKPYGAGSHEAWFYVIPALALRFVAGKRYREGEREFIPGQQCVGLFRFI